MVRFLFFIPILSALLPQVCISAHNDTAEGVLDLAGQRARMRRRPSFDSDQMNRAIYHFLALQGTPNTTELHQHALAIIHASNATTPIQAQCLKALCPLHVIDQDSAYQFSFTRISGLYTIQIQSLGATHSLSFYKQAARSLFTPVYEAIRQLVQDSDTEPSEGAYAFATALAIIAPDDWHVPSEEDQSFLQRTRAQAPRTPLDTSALNTILDTILRPFAT